MLKDQLVLIYFFPEEPQTMAALIHHTLEKAISLQYKYIHMEKNPYQYNKMCNITYQQ